MNVPDDPAKKYVELGAKLLDQEFFAPAPLGAPDWSGIWDGTDSPTRPPRLPGDLNVEDEQRVAAAVAQLVNMPSDLQWFSLNERERIPWLEAALARTAPGSLEEPNNDSPSDVDSVPRLTVQIEKQKLLLDQTEYEVNSQQALRWVKVLAEHPEEWISGSVLKAYDEELDGVRTDKLRKNLPNAVNDLIDSRSGAGSRIRLKPGART